MKSFAKQLIFVITLGLGLFCNQSYAYGFYDNFVGLNVQDQHAKKYDAKSLANKITLFNFIYTNCATTCTVQTHQLSQVYKALSPELKKHIQFVSVSLDPVKDDPAKLKAFAEKYNADWAFLSMDYLSLVTLRERLVLFKEDYGKTLYEAIEHVKAKTNNNKYKLEEHTAALWLIGPKGLVRQKYVGNPVDVKRLKRELNALHRVSFSKDKKRKLNDIK